MKKTLTILALGVVGASANATTFVFKAMHVDIPDWSASITNFNVIGLDSPIVDVNLRMRKVEHSFSNDMGAVLSNNVGVNTLLFDGPGTGFTVGMNWNWMFDDSAAAPLPDGSPLESGEFQPGQNEFGDIFTNTTPNATTMSALTNGSDGTWTLHMQDFSFLDFGSIRRVDLIITTSQPGPGSNGNGPKTRSVVPEPASMAILGLGAVALIRRRRK